MDILIDFDFTCVVPDYPNFIDIGAVPVLKALVANGHNLILFTCRSDRPYHLPDGTVDYTGLTDAVNWFKKNEIPLYGIQRNPKQDEFTDSPKAFGELLIDDTALGCPLKYDLKISQRPFMDWEKAEEWLENNKILK